MALNIEIVSYALVDDYNIDVVLNVEDTTQEIPIALKEVTLKIEASRFKDNEILFRYLRDEIRNKVLEVVRDSIKKKAIRKGEIALQTRIGNTIDVDSLFDADDNYVG